ncbi:MAG: hypothetical protein P1P84_06610 [Deferrisomatales bacterium]|nr:hypothetical protein [Deferrisomatales bacterium]
MKTAASQSPATLSEEELQLCRIFGTSPEEYAGQKMALATAAAQEPTGTNILTLAKIAELFGNTPEDLIKHGG